MALYRAHAENARVDTSPGFRALADRADLGEAHGAPA